MRLPPGLTQLGAAFLIGMACTFWLLPVFMGGKVQKLRLERDKSLAEVESLRSELLKLKESPTLHDTPPVVRGIVPHTDGPQIDQRVALEAKNRLQKELAHYVGQPIDGVNPILIYTLLQGKMMKIDGVLFQIDLKFLAVTEEIALFVRLAKVSDP